MSGTLVPFSGDTILLGLLGHPLGHSRSVTLINEMLQEQRRDAVYVPMDVDPDDLGDLLSSLRAIHNFQGAVVTMPHKAAILPFLDELTPEAKQVGAANVIHCDGDGRMRGTMLDGEGFIGGLRLAGRSVEGKRVYLVGAGGAASGVAFAIAKYGAVKLTIYNRTAEKARDLAERVSGAASECEVQVGTANPAGHDIVVNGTSLGLHDDDPVPCEVEGLTGDVVAADIVIRPHLTPFLSAAQKRGCDVHGGEPMLTAQLQMMIDFMLA